MIELFHESCEACSKLVTNNYSTSFSLGIKMFAKELRQPIYNIYGFVRFADEIVDTFHDQDKELLSKEFRNETMVALERGLSLNPILHAFQRTVVEYNIDKSLITAFLDSMDMDLYKTTFDRQQYEKYIYGSAEVIGLMCLKVFVGGDKSEYEKLSPAARQLGSAFQKINFLRDISSDYHDRGRVYFPDVIFSSFDSAAKTKIEQEIKEEFDQALIGIKNLPEGAKLGVYVAYKYYKRLLKKIQKCSATEVREQRIRVGDSHKLLLLSTSALKYQLRAI